MKTENFFSAEVQQFEAEKRKDLVSNWLKPENKQSSYRKFVLNAYRNNLTKHHTSKQL